MFTTKTGIETNNQIVDINVFDNIFSNFFNQVKEIRGPVTTYDDDGNCVIYYEVPGYNKSNISFEVIDGLYHIVGKKIEHLGKNEFRYKVNLSHEYELSEILIKDGILSLNLKKIDKSNLRFNIKEV